MSQTIRMPFWGKYTAIRSWRMSKRAPFTVILRMALRPSA